MMFTVVTIFFVSSHLNLSRSTNVPGLLTDTAPSVFHGKRLRHERHGVWPRDRQTRP